MKKLFCKCIPHRLVMALDIAKAVGTPFPEPDISSPSNNFANLSFIISISNTNNQNKIKNHILLKSSYIALHCKNYKLIMQTRFLKRYTVASRISRFWLLPMLRYKI